MALRQRTWSILIRPFHTTKNGFITHYTDVPLASRVRLGQYTSGTDTLVELEGVGGGMEDWNTVGTDEGGWVMWYTTTSYPRLREKYGECVKTHPRDMVRIVELMPIDVMVTPRA